MKTKTRKINLTKRSIEGLPIPSQGGGKFCFDERTPGLAVRVSSTGRRSFVWYKKVDGRPVKRTLGTFPAMTVEQARRAASALNANGPDPAPDAEAELTGKTTLGKAFDKYLELWAKPRKRSWSQDEWTFKKYFSHWKARPLASIKRGNVQQLFVKIKTDAGPYAANRVIALLRAIFNRAAEWGFEGKNPASGVQVRKNEKRRERFLGDDHHGAGEVARFFEELMADSNRDLQDFVLLSLYTGARCGNVVSMRWDDVSMEKAEWTIPRTKTDPYTVSLCSAALDVLEARRRDIPGEWVFPGRGDDAPLTIHPRKPWRAFLTRAKIEDFRVHDLRRTLGSWMALKGSTELVIGEALGHKFRSVTSIYSRLNRDAVRAAVERAVMALRTKGGLEKKAEVVSIEAR